MELLLCTSDLRSSSVRGTFLVLCLVLLPSVVGGKLRAVSGVLVGFSSSSSSFTSTDSIKEFILKVGFPMVASCWTMFNKFCLSALKVSI